MPGRKVRCLTDEEELRRQAKEVHIPRPQNSFMLFRSEMLTDWKKTAPPRGRTMADASREIAKMWKNLTRMQRAHWEERAKQVKKEHEEKYPDYRFMPNKNKTQRRAKKVRSTKNKDLDDSATSDSSHLTLPHCHTPDSFSSNRQSPQSRSATTSPSSSIGSLSPLSLFDGLPGGSPLSNTTSVWSSPTSSGTCLPSLNPLFGQSTAQPGLGYERTTEIRPEPLNLSALALGSSSSFDASEPLSHLVQVPSSWSAPHCPLLPNFSASYEQPLPPNQLYANHFTHNPYQYPVNDYKQYSNDFWAPVDGFSDGALLTASDVHHDFELHSDYRNLF